MATRDAPLVLDRADWASHDTLWRGRFEGRDLGTGVTVLFFETDRVGAGPVLHKHPYDEVFVIREGRAVFTIGDRRIEAGAGQIILGPAETPHKFVNAGPGRLETMDIHLSPDFIQTDLEEREDE